MHRVCPQCKSDNVIGDFLMISGSWTCLDCDYRGSFILEMDDPDYAEFLREEEEHNRRV
ncbi:MAG: hypothetical protein ACYCSA_04195 [Thermoplasmataceae archaeon]